MKLNKIVQENQAQTTIQDVVINIFKGLDMDDAMMFGNARAFAFHINTDMLFVDWLPNRGHKEWFNDKAFYRNHANEVNKANGFDWAKAYGDGFTIEHEAIWGRFGMMPMSVRVFEDAGITAEEARPITDNGMPYACVWALKEAKSYLSNCASALRSFGLPKETVMYSAYKDVFYFDPFCISEEWKAAKKKKVDDYAGRWRKTIGDAVERHVNSIS